MNETPDRDDELERLRHHVEALTAALDFYRTCPRCEGYGDEPHTDDDVAGPAPCSACEGMGQGWDQGKRAEQALGRLEDQPNATQCPNCGGSQPCIRADCQGVSEAPLSFAQLRQANVQRCETAFHALDHWNPMEWGAACAGEVGEGINAAKKLRRVRDSEQYKKTLPTTDVTEQDVADEIADTVIYADLWAANMGIDLGAAVASKFNRTSDKVSSDVKLPARLQARED